MAGRREIAANSGWRNLLWLGLAAVASISGFLLVSLWRGAFYHVFPTGEYLLFHSFVEFSSIVVSFGIFTIGWYGFKQKQDSRNLALALTFFAVGLIDFAHAFSYVGMPNFLSPNSVGKAATLFVAARLVAALGLLLLIFIPSKPLPRWLSPYSLLGVVTAAALGFSILYSYYPGILPATFIEGEGLTPFKNTMEYVVIGLEIAAIGVLQKKHVFSARSTLLLQIGLVFGVFSELAFTLYASAFDSFNLLGHIYKIAFYYVILQAIFVSALKQPYSDLKKTQVDLEASFASIGSALASSLDLDKTLSLISVLSSDMLKSPHALVALKKEGENALAVRSHRGLKQPPAEIRLKDNLAARVWESRAPMWIDDVRRQPEVYKSLIAAPEGLRSAVAAPIMKDSAILGEIAVYSPRPFAFGEPAARLLAAFARQAAVAIENSRLYESELQSRDRIESYAAQLAILHNISLQLNRETDTNRLLKTVLDGAMQMTLAGVGLMTLINEGKTEVISFQQADWYPHRCDLSTDLSSLHQKISRTVQDRSRESLRITGMGESDIDIHPPAGHVRLHGLLVGTIRDIRGRIKGHFMLSGKSGGAEFTREDEEIVSLLAAQSSVALISAENFEREHYVAESLQASLLPTVPKRDDLDVGLLYHSAGPYGKVGGDFYDFVEIGPNRIAIAIGDVCGKGIEAATYTAMIKYMLRAYIGEGMYPGDCLTRLNANIGNQLSSEQFITACLAFIDTTTGAMTFTSAGHPPPIICHPGHASMLNVLSAVPLGVLPDQKYLSSQMNISDACQIVLYSDGLIEARPEGGEPFGEERAASAVANTCNLPAHQVADELAAAALKYAGGHLRDDIALLVVRPLGDSAANACKT